MIPTCKNWFICFWGMWKASWTIGQARGPCRCGCILCSRLMAFPTHDESSQMFSHVCSCNTVNSIFILETNFVVKINKSCSCYKRAPEHTPWARFARWCQNHAKYRPRLHAKCAHPLQNIAAWDRAASKIVYGTKYSNQMWIFTLELSLICFIYKFSYHY